jgi:hypothetical protein
MPREPSDILSKEEAEKRMKAALLGARIAGHKPMESLTRKKGKAQPKVCPECSHVFQGDGWDGIDAHWRARHEKKMPYEKAWPQIKSGKYKKV